MRAKLGNQGSGQWDAEQEEEDTEIISTTETAWSIENRYIPAEKPLQNLQFPAALLEMEESPIPGLSSLLLIPELLLFNEEMW